MIDVSTLRIGIVGAGVMGAGIAQVLAVAGHPVVCHDLAGDVLQQSRERVRSGRYGLDSGVERGLLTEEEAQSAFGRIEFSDDPAAVHDADLVIEAVPERLDLKVTLFRELDRWCAPHTILASNSSGFPIQAMAAATDRPDRVVGWHWASPAPVMRFAEIVRGPATSDETVATVVELAERAGKNPVVVQDAPMAWGYVANRVYAAMVREANRVADEGVATREEIDQLLVDCFRWPSGPFGMARGARSGWT